MIRVYPKCYIQVDGEQKNNNDDDDNDDDDEQISVKCKNAKKQLHCQNTMKWEKNKTKRNKNKPGIPNAITNLKTNIINNHNNYVYHKELL